MKDNRRIHIWFPTIAALAMVAGLFLGMTLSRGRAPGTGVRSGEAVVRDNKVNATLSLINQLYIEDVDTDSLVDALMPHLMAELDPHSVYMPPVSTAEANESLGGEIEGIGVMFNMVTDTVVVVNVVPHGPSYKAGMQNGDRIIMINDSLVAGQSINQDDVKKMLRGKRGTQVTVSVERQGLADLVPVTITRDKIALKSVDAAFMIEPGVGFVRLAAFSRTTHQEIVGALDRLRGQGMTKLVFDLRDNSGGFLDQAILLANEFLPEGKLIVYTEDRFGKRNESVSDGRGGFTETELVVLINERSASSSEILAGAIQDNDRGTIVGLRSFGKGLVQQQIGFRDGSAIRLTTARYYTPTGRSIQKPYGDGHYEDDIYERYLHSEMFSVDSVRFDEDMKFTTPGGKTVYGGGGIMPDVYVPWDTVGVTRYFVEARDRNIIHRYALDYADRHREQINSVESIGQMRALLDSDTDLLEDFVRYARSRGLEPDRGQIATSRDLLMAYIRSYIARNSPLEDNGFYSEYYHIDRTILKGLEMLGIEDI